MRDRNSYSLESRCAVRRMPPLSPRSASPLADSTKSGAAAAMPPSKHRCTDKDDIINGVINSSVPDNVLLWKERQRKQLCRLGEALSGPSRASKSKSMMYLLSLLSNHSSNHILLLNPCHI